MDPDVAALVREERLIDAATLASERGDARTASALFERACAWARAAVQSLHAGEPARALELAIEGGDDEVADQAAARIAVDAAAAEGLAARLIQRGHDAWAARLLQRIGKTSAAALCWERAGDALKAAELMARDGQPSAAARVLQAALRSDPNAWSAAVALGALLARFGKTEAAVRTLQRVPSDAPERRDALVHLVPALVALGLTRAAEDASEELAALGGAPLAQAQAADEPRTRQLFGRYEVVREVASSPSARVLECVDVVQGERVAVKIFAAWNARGSGRDALSRFEREVRAMRALDHPNIVPLRDFVPDGPAIVLAWMAGGTLEEMVAAAAPFAPARAVEIALAVLAALGDAHRLGILHRDVKPANVLLDDAGGAKLSDFGVAHLGDLSTTATAGVFGTLAYMSPEQRQGLPATARSDLFAVGVMLREMLTGERPTAMEAPKSQPSEAHEELGELHDAVVAGLSASDPSARPADAFAARALLSALHWPASNTKRARVHSERHPSANPNAGRVEVQPSGAILDRWTERVIDRVRLSEESLARARTFALADHPALQAVLRVDREEASIWLEAPAGRPLDRPLTARERSDLEGAIGALHRAGAAHGSVDSAHVMLLDRGGVQLRFEVNVDPAEDVEHDWIALAKL